MRLELSNRMRYEGVDFFRTAPDSEIRNYDYGFFGNRLQVGARVLRDPVEIFVQYQDSLITSLPRNAPGPGGTYFTNTPDENQEKGILRNAWLRAGINQSSGDPDPDDDEHESFLEVLPTSRLYAMYPFYDLMKNRDLFGQLALRPAAIVTLTTAAHWPRVSQDDELPYAGGGATSNSVFGYSAPARAGGRASARWSILCSAWRRPRT